MASIKLNSPGYVVDKLAAFRKNIDQVSKDALLEAAKVVEDELRAGLNRVIGKNIKYEGRSKGDLMDSTGYSEVKVDNNGDYNVYVGFSQKERNNTMIAFTIEYGKLSQNQSPKPFIKQARKKSMDRVYDIVESAIMEALEDEDL